ncbi:hypothetical protein AJ80_05106 [Polytolypa hystricis UAMH7299]|uniref:Zn(2)-C6 fungal-type domain-containing protein n=1 Tax=Polytolypa hystricis (strain UAMH7299) TaxID=1447883 RepID=A0A2B7Y6W2_POLH7|nr:hypothetical protein AJ80_05106 [Polytolypa hystricis UAMH7299]
MNDARSKPPPLGFSHRPSRRFACDRCRSYKARCERNADSGSCERCVKARLPCTTNFDHVTQLSMHAVGQQQQQQHRGRINGNTNGNTNGSTSNHAIREPTHDPSIRAPQESPPDGQEQVRDNLTSPRLSRPLSPQGQQQNSVKHPFSRPRAMSTALLSTSDGSLSHEGSSSANSSHSDSHPTMMSSERHSIGGSEGLFLHQDRTGLDTMDFSMDLSMNHLMFDKVDFAMLADGHHQSGLHDPMSRRPVGTDDMTSFDDETNHVIQNPSTSLAVKPHDSMNGNCNMGPPEPSFPNSNNDHQQRLARSHKDLLKLSLELMDDQEALDALSPLNSRAMPKDHHHFSLATEDSPIHRVLKRTSRYWEILKAISSRSSYTGETDSSWHRRCPTNTLLLVQLLTTYICLVRICRAAFLHLYHVLQVIPPDQLGTVLNLPSLQFGEFQMESNPTIQVQALIELSSSMLLRIEEALGISTGSGPGLAGGTVNSQTLESHGCRNSLMNDPVAVSLREIILSQERIQLAANGVGDMSLMGVMKNLKRLLQQR